MTSRMQSTLRYSGAGPVVMACSPKLTHKLGRKSAKASPSMDAADENQRDRNLQNQKTSGARQPRPQP